MKMYLFNSKAVIRALAAGRIVWCVETGEGWQLGKLSLNRARRVARLIFCEEERQTFFFNSGS